MSLKTCANCSRATEAAAAFGVGFERCPECGGAWMDEAAFNALLARRHSPHDHRSGGRRDHGFSPPPRLGRLLKLAAAGVLVLAIGVGLAGYYLVWPLLSRGVSGGNLAKTGKDAITKQIEAAGVPKDISTWARESAKKEIERTAREKLGLPAKETPTGGEAATAKGDAGKAEGSEAD